MVQQLKKSGKKWLQATSLKKSKMEKKKSGAADFSQLPCCFWNPPFPIKKLKYLKLNHTFSKAEEWNEIDLCINAKEKVEWEGGNARTRCENQKAVSCAQHKIVFLFLVYILYMAPDHPLLLLFLLVWSGWLSWLDWEMEWNLDRRTTPSAAAQGKEMPHGALGEYCRAQPRKWPSHVWSWGGCDTLQARDT